MLQESDEEKRAWLTQAEKRIPIGARVCVIRSDLACYMGALGVVVGYDTGICGEWPMVRVRFDHPIDGTEIDSFYCDGSVDDEIAKE